MKISYMDRERPRLFTINADKVIQSRKRAGMQRSRAQSLIVDNIITDRSAGDYDYREKVVTLYPHAQFVYYQGLYAGIAKTLYETTPKNAPIVERPSDQNYSKKYMIQS